MASATSRPRRSGASISHSANHGSRRSARRSRRTSGASAKCDSGGTASCGCASSIARSSVVPEREQPTTKGKMGRVKVVMTLLVRDEADIIDVNLAYHLARGVDEVIVTDHRSSDGTRERLEAWADRG